jgi:hypothetical protein
MGKVQDALNRLEGAVALLERASGGVDEAARRLVAAQADYDALVETTDGVAARLDVVIGRLDRVLEG